MKKLTSLFVTVLFVVTFVACVYGYVEGGDEVFSFRVWVDNLTQIGDDYSLKEDLITAWTKNYYFYYEYHEGFDRYFREREDYRLRYDGDEEVLEFLSQIPLFFERLWVSVRIVVDHVSMTFQGVDLLLPWNATVPKEVFYGV